MLHFLAVLNRFRRDERGAFGVIFAVMAIVLVALSGAAVDFTSMQNSRTRAQVALDAAALALQPTIYTGTVSVAQTTIQGQAQKLLNDRLADSVTSWDKCVGNSTGPCVTVNMPTIDTVNGELTLQATLKVPMNFVSLVGVPSLTAQIESVATRKKLNLEVAMVLDNSGSMSTSFGSGRNSTRLTVLQAAAVCATNILFYGVKTCSTATTGLPLTDNVKMAVVPFNDEVNIGASHASDFWIDRAGGNDSFPNDNFDSDSDDSTPYTATTDRISLFSKIKNKNGTALSWGGCVEARMNNGSSKQYDTDDTTPVAGQQDTLFTPLFAPDEPDSGGYDNNYISDKQYNSLNAPNPLPVCKADPQVVWKQVKTKCSAAASGNNTVTNYGKSCTGTTTNTLVETDKDGAVTTVGLSSSATASNLPATWSNNAKPSSSAQDTYITSTSNSNITNERDSTYIYPFSAREYQERLCKYEGSQMTSSASLGFGPNADCPASQIQPLTATPATVINSVNAMVADGNTNVQEGTAWGFRVLSPTEPFTEGLPYDKSTSKVMIVMTDGENTFNADSSMNGASLFAAYAYPWDNYRAQTNGYRNRMGNKGWDAGDFETAINTRLAQTCVNAKAAGIVVYTIGLATNATSDPTGNHNLLTNCASDPVNDAFFPTTADSLTGAFVSIANQLAALRLAK